MAMSKECSFDIVSRVDPMEITNAVHQTSKEIEQRFDLKGTRTLLTFDQAKGVLEVAAPDEFKIKSVVDILTQRLTRRSVSLKFFDFGKIEPAAGSRFRQVIQLRQGIDQDRARDLIKRIKELKLKVQAQVQDDQVRVMGKNKDDLQAVIRKLRQAELDIELQFVNYR